MSGTGTPASNERAAAPNEADGASNAGPTVDSAAQRRRILLAVGLALMAVISSVSGLNVAQREIALDLEASQSDVLWMINIYAITLAALLLPLGAIGDRWGRKPVLVTGLIVFGVASTTAGLAPTTEAMLAARLFTGVGAAMVMPVTLAVITSSFPEADRSQAIGIWTGIAAGGGVVGMYLSALLIDLATWRWLFVLPVVLVAAALAVAVRHVPDSREHAEHRFDIVGSVLASMAVVGLIWTLHEGPEAGWTSAATVVSACVGGVAVAAFGWWELRHPGPILDVRLFRDRRLAIGSVTLLVVFGVQAGIFVVLFPYFQAVLGWSGLRSTLAMMPMAVAMMTASGSAPRLAAAVGARVAMSAGVGLGSVGLAMLALRVSVDGGYLSVLPGMVTMGLGMGLSMTPSTEAITGALPRDRQGVASALNDVTREFGTALGVALLGAVLTAGYRTAFDARLDEVAGPIPDGVIDEAREGIATALAAADRVGSGQSEEVGSLAMHAFVDGWQQAMWAGAVVMAALLGVVVVRGPDRSGVSPWAERRGGRPRRVR